MPKLYFRYGAMKSAKTMNLLAVAHNYETNNKQKVLVCTTLDSGQIETRAGLSRKADVVIRTKEDLPSNAEDAKHGRTVSPVANTAVPVICYGLRTDFQTRLFPGSQRLLELADSIEEIKTTCALCNGSARKAVFNMRYNPATRCKIVHGEQVVLETDLQTSSSSIYVPVCSVHYFETSNQ